MSIALYNIKGGVGKTSIAANLALTLNYEIFTNDQFSPVNEIVPNCTKINFGQSFPKKYDKGSPLIIDLGGHIERSTHNALVNSSVVLVPILPDELNFKTTAHFIKHLIQINDNMAFIANRCKKNDYNEMVKAISKFFPNHPIFEIKESVCIGNLIRVKKSVKSQCSKGGLPRHHYSVVNQQFDRIIDYCRRFQLIEVM